MKNNYIEINDLSLNDTGDIQVEVTFEKMQPRTTYPFPLKNIPTFKEILQKDTVLAKMKDCDTETLSDITITVRSKNEGKVYHCDASSWSEDAIENVVITFERDTNTLTAQREIIARFYEDAANEEKAFKRRLWILLITMVFIGIGIAAIHIGGFVDNPKISPAMEIVKLFGPPIIAILLVIVILSGLRRLKNGGGA